MQAQLVKGALSELADAMHEEVQPHLNWLAELDVTIALAEVSAQQNFCKPKVTEDNILSISKGNSSLHEYLIWENMHETWHASCERLDGV
jgi:DNA mismatch repair ATPase MutS